MSELLVGVTDVMTAVTSVLSSMSSTIVATPLLMLSAVGLPVVSFGVGLLIRVLHRT